MKKKTSKMVDYCKILKPSVEILLSRKQHHTTEDPAVQCDSCLYMSVTLKVSKMLL